MQFDYEKCRSMLFDAVVEALTRKADALRAYAGGDPVDYERNPYVSGIALDILPWDRFMTLAIRLSSDGDDNRFDLAAWKHYEFASSIHKLPKLDAATEYVANAYALADDQGIDSQEMAHLIFQAAADALVDERVTAVPEANGVDAPKIADRFPDSVFQYMVFDPDKVVHANYCELVLANRVTKRLLGRTSDG